jgi:hypothetical protein
MSRTEYLGPLIGVPHAVRITRGAEALEWSVMATTNVAAITLPDGDDAQAVAVRGHESGHALRRHRVA